MARWFVDRSSRRGGMHSVSLRRLFPEGQFVGAADWQVTGCTDDHRRLEPGQVFVATRRTPAGYDGHDFVADALRRGAAGVILERPSDVAGRLQVVVNDGAAAFGQICQALAGDPSRKLATIGVAGMLGRGLTALYARAILAEAGERTGLVGALGFHDGAAMRPLGAGFDDGQDARTLGRRLGAPAGDFIPSASALATLMAELAGAGCSGAILEAPLAAIERRAFAGIELHALLAADSGTLPGYPDDVARGGRRTLARLARQVLPGGVVIVCADDPNAEILGGVNLDAHRVAFAMNPSSLDRGVDVWGRVTQSDASGIRLSLTGFERSLEVALPLIGPRTAAAATAAAALAWALEIPADYVQAGLESVRALAGSLEQVNHGQDFDIRIDDARTALALKEALLALRAISAGRIHAVVSAEGDGNRPERQAIAAVAEALADRVTLTTTNPRDEDPNQILDDLLAGFIQPGRVRALPDRQTAIEATLADAQPGDTVLVAGKGRQAYQIIANRVTSFDDHAVVEAWLNSRAGQDRAQRRA